MRCSLPPSASYRHRSTCSAFSLKIAKLTPDPSQVAPSGYGLPRQTLSATSYPHHSRGPVGRFIRTLAGYSSISEGDPLERREGQPQPAGPVAGLVADLVAGLLELERLEQACLGRADAAVGADDGLARARQPVFGVERGGIPHGGLGGVIEAAQQAGDVPHRRTGLTALRQRPGRLALE